MPIAAPPAPTNMNRSEVRPPRSRRAARQARQDDGSGALDVVVEARQPPPIPLEDAHGVVLLEVLPLDDGGREDSRDGVHERLHDRVVGGAAQPGRPVTDVQRVVEQLATVGPDIERDGQRLRRIDARRGGVQRQLARPGWPSPRPPGRRGRGCVRCR